MELWQVWIPSLYVTVSVNDLSNPSVPGRLPKYIPQPRVTVVDSSYGAIVLSPSVCTFLALMATVQSISSSANSPNSFVFNFIQFLSCLFTFLVTKVHN